MQIQTIDFGHGYEITSHGNGWAYVITRESDRKSVWLQDDEAALFRAEYNDLGRDHVTSNTRASRFSWNELLDTMCGSYFDQIPHITHK